MSTRQATLSRFNVDLANTGRWVRLYRGRKWHRLTPFGVTWCERTVTYQYTAMNGRPSPDVACPKCWRKRVPA